MLQLMRNKKNEVIQASRGAGGIETAAKFDGSNDYLTRGADLTGATDSTTGIISLFFRIDSELTSQRIFEGANAWLGLFFNAKQLQLTLYNPAHTLYRNPKTTQEFEPSAKWRHYIISINAGVFQCYVDDALETISENGAAVDFDFTDTDWAIAAQTAGGNKAPISIQHFYFQAGEYLDLSIASNRRKFTEFDASGQLVPVSLGSDGSTPTGTAPIIYLPLTELATVGVNKGSGGNFTVNGTLEIASTSPADPSVEAVKLNGVTDWFSKPSGLTGAADGKEFLFSMQFKIPVDTSAPHFIGAGASSHIYCQYSAGWVYAWVKNSAGIIIAQAHGSGYIPGNWHNIILAFDLVNAKAYQYRDNIDVTSSPISTNDNMDLTHTDWRIGSSLVSGSGLAEYEFSELYYSDVFTDIKIEGNLRKLITADGKPANPRNLNAVVGTALLYLPNPAATVEINQGSGGDFVKNGTPVDARSTPLYYYAEPAYFDGVNDYCQIAGILTGVTDGKEFTFSTWLKPDNTAGFKGIFYIGQAGTDRLGVYQSGSRIGVQFRNSAGTVLKDISSSSLVTGVESHVLITVNCTTQNAYIYIDNVLTVGASDVTNDNIDLTSDLVQISYFGNANRYSGIQSEVFFHNSFIDPTVEANRAKFIDPVTLRPTGNLIETTGVIPLVYLSNEYSTFENNLGSGGDFTVTGALTRGTTSPSDVKAA